MKPLDLDEIEKSLKEISPWPWYSDRANHICDAEAYCVIWYDHLKGETNDYNSNFITQAPVTVDALVKEVRFLQGQLKISNKQVMELDKHLEKEHQCYCEKI